MSDKLEILYKEVGKRPKPMEIEDTLEAKQKKSKGVEYASDYDTIKRWVIDRVNELEEKESKKSNKNSIKKKRTSNLEQREYPERFFDNFYANLQNE